MGMNIRKIVNSLVAEGLTQAEIAAQVGCSQPTISGIANGQVGKARPSYKVVTGLQSLAAAHGIGDDGETQPTKKSLPSKIHDDATKH